MPRFGEILPADVWAAATRTLTDISIEDIFDLPDLTTLYPAVTVPASAVANSFGAWTTLVADVGTGKRLLYVIITPDVGVTLNWEIELGVGAAPNESRITRYAAAWQADSGAGKSSVQIVPVFRVLADNARLSARARNSVATAYNYLTAVLYA